MYTSLSGAAAGSGNGQFNVPDGIAVDSLGYVYVADSNNFRVQKFTSAGGYLTQWGSQGSGNGQFEYSYGIAIDNLDNVYVADESNFRIQKFTTAGAYVAQWGSEGSGNGQLEFPAGIAVDDFGNVYVADMGNDRIEEFTSAGTYVTQWGSLGAGPGQFDDPYAVAVDGPGNVIYVADAANNRVEVLGQNILAVAQYTTGDQHLRADRGVHAADRAEHRFGHRRWGKDQLQRNGNSVRPERGPPGPGDGPNRVYI